MKLSVVLLALFSILVPSYTNLVVEECPTLWVTGENNCYRFFKDIKKTWLQAKDYCKSISAKLLSVDEEKKHTLVSNWLMENDTLKLEWYTSGLRDENDKEVFRWKSIQNEEPVKTFFYWIDEKNKEKADPLTAITYVKVGNTWGWDLTDPKLPRAFICEIPRTEVQMITTEERDFTYGQIDISFVEKGPKFVQEPPRSVIFASSAAYKRVSFECVASGNPLPTYRWVKELKDGNTEEIKSSKKFTLTNGKLVIHDPTENDVGTYQCAATNKFGTILSNRVTMQFGFINDFSKTKRDAIRAQLNVDTAIPCNPPPFFPSVHYKWFKDTTKNYIRSDLKPYIFISRNGKLYFSRVKEEDKGNYQCIINNPLPGFQDAKTSMPVALVVGTGGDERPPQIHTDFPATYPGSPRQGDNVTVECFAIGTGDLAYSWNRKDGQALSKRISFEDNSRVMKISKILLEDAGTYTCTVSSTGLGGTGTVSKPVTLDVQSIPFFTKKLDNHHVDENGDFSLHCVADGKPDVTYAWFKNGRPFNNATLEDEDRGRITFNTTRIFIKKANARRDDAMYQCASKNYVTTYSAGQVRVLSFPPSFAKRPMDPVTYAAIDGTATMVCAPEAAPVATKIWYKNKQRLSVTTATAARMHMLKNGNLVFKKVQESDQGDYTCVAQNDHGKANSSGSLLVLSKSVITVKPLSQIVQVNETVHLTCEAAVHPSLDFMYIWEINGIPLDLDFNEDWRLKRYRNLERYKRGVGAAWGDLLIRNISYEEEGIYKCIARTPQDEAYAEANITVIGPPGQPAGLEGTESSITSSSIILTWSAGTNHGSILTSYAVEAWSNLRPYWEYVKKNICPWYGDPTDMTTNECREMTPLEKENNKQYIVKSKNRLSTKITGLMAFNQYKFRVRAYNSFGAGEPSLVSATYPTSPAAPTVIPRNVGGGGGKEGVLTIRWDPLDISEQNGPGLKYRVFWIVDTQSTLDKVSKFDVDGNTTSHTVTIGPQNFFKLYRVQVQAYNDKGFGPKSKWVKIYSAEGMPVATPMNIRAQPFNSSAILVLWNPVPDDREALKGRILGYRINYWRYDRNNQEVNKVREQKDYKRATILGQTDRGKIIGLRDNVYYQMNVMVFTSAGNGPKSANREERTWRKAPQDPPREVWLEQRSATSVDVHWRGIGIANDEEPLEGYIVRYWRAGESMTDAVDHYAGKVVDTTLTNLEREPTRYYLRLLGYSRGGIGKMSSPITQFQLGPGPYLFVNPKPGSAAGLKPCGLLISLLIITLFKCLS